MTPRRLYCSQQQLKEVTPQRLWLLHCDASATGEGVVHVAGTGASVSASTCVMYSATGVGTAYTATVMSAAGARRFAQGSGWRHRHDRRCRRWRCVHGWYWRQAQQALKEVTTIGAGLRVRSLSRSVTRQALSRCPPHLVKASREQTDPAGASAMYSTPQSRCYAGAIYST